MNIILKKQPKYKLGEIVIVLADTDKEKVVMGKIVGADCKISEPTYGRWFYIIKARNLGKIETICLYEEEIISLQKEK